MSNLAIEVKNLSFRYRNHLALDDLSFSIEKGSINGFVGPNGAGKTTTLKILSTLLKPKIGSVKILGLDVIKQYREVRGKIGFMPDHFSMYKNMTVFEYLDFFGAAYGMNTKTRDTVIGDILALTDMDKRKEDFINNLSRGMQQRVNLARVLINDPELLLLDEPASGLDPRARIELMEILKELSNMGKTIFISSHILSELGNFCDSFTIIDNGQTQYSGSLEGLGEREDNQARYFFALSNEPNELKEKIESMPEVTTVEISDKKQGLHVTFNKDNLQLNDLISIIMKAGGELQAIEPEKVELQKAFMNLTTAGVREK